MSPAENGEAGCLIWWGSLTTCKKERRSVLSGMGAFLTCVVRQVGELRLLERDARHRADLVEGKYCVVQCVVCSKQ